MSNGNIKSSFIKRVTVRKKTRNYPSYLIFKKIDKKWKIVTEGDLITDKNLIKRRAKRYRYATKGDFNGDGKIEKVWLIPPKFPKEQNLDTFGMCLGNEGCECYLSFSNSKIPFVKVKNCIDGMPVNEGDLDGDGKDEIGILPDWWMSCWRGYRVYTLKNNKWKYLVKPFSTHCNQWEQGVDAIRKDKLRKNHVIINYSEFINDDIVTVSKSVPINK